MPRPTFANLPPTKRERIIDLAVAEFAAHPYPIASLSRIVARAGIAKGSIYQYFENKQDLYLFILDYAAQQQLELLRAQIPPDPEISFFALLRWQMQASAQVGLAAPLFTRLMYRAVTDDLPFRDQVTCRLQTTGAAHLQALLARGVERGEIDPALDLELAVFVLQSLMANLHELIVRRLGITLEAAAGDVTMISGPATERLYDQIVQILQFGLGTRGAPVLSLGDIPCGC
jgi:AcrR family transcriptional regulator